MPIGNALDRGLPIEIVGEEITVENDPIAAARARIAAHRGELRGWRPLTVGDVAVNAVQVLGMARGVRGMVGIRVVVAGRSDEAVSVRGPQVAERLLRRRSVLGEDDPFVVESIGTPQPGNGEAEDPLIWPWTTLVIHVPEQQLPAIAGLVSDTVPQVNLSTDEESSR
jgi:hypothetical protein